MVQKRANIGWADLPAERRRRIVVLLSNLIQSRLAIDREVSHEGAADPARRRVTG
jgi:hypothetical protein